MRRFAFEWQGIERKRLGKGGREGLGEFYMMIAWIKGQGVKNEVKKKKQRK